ncbi:MAG: dTDP-4-keto-6-deoxy-D-glucose epimerase [Brevundimonas sp.]|nr:MAG: dTDP-4-keto-6-deoxy-D-glucose epimerase [Brevundimonas sp.]
MSRRLRVEHTPIRDLVVLTRQPVGDERGFLERIFCADELADILGTRSISQINRTLTVEQGTIRGLHFQEPPFAEMKLVSCLQGEVFDVAVDLRPTSPTFLNWHAEILSGDNGRTLVIPEGFAHGFQTLTPECVMLYLHTAPFTSSAEGGLNPMDDRLRINWPLAVRNISARDAAHPMMTPEFAGIQV